MKPHYFYGILILIIAAIAAVTVIGYRNGAAKQEKVTVDRALNNFNHEFTEAGFSMGYKLKNAEQDSTVYAYLSDQAAKEYLLETNQTFIDLCDFIKEKELKQNPEKFNRAVQILSFTFSNQAKVIKEMNDPILMNRAVNILKSELSLLDELGQGMETDILNTCKDFNI